jgi:hypothetical protein
MQDDIQRTALIVKTDPGTKMLIKAFGRPIRSFPQKKTVTK